MRKPIAGNWKMNGSRAALAEGQALAIACEPVWAIGTGRMPTDERIAAMHRFLRERLVARFGAEGSAILPALWRIGEAGECRCRLRRPGRRWSTGRWCFADGGGLRPGRHFVPRLNGDPVIGKARAAAKSTEV